MKRFLLRIQTYLRKLAGVPVGDEMPLPQSDIEKSLYEICKNNPNGIMPGVQPSGTISITENGTYDVAEFAEAGVEVEGGGITVDGIALNSEPSGDIVIHNAVADYAFKNKQAITGVDIIYPEQYSDGTIGAEAFNMCTGMTRFFAPYTFTSRNYSVANCSNLRTVVFGGIDGIFVFQNATNLAIFDLTGYPISAYFRLQGAAFMGCSNLKTIVLRREQIAVVSQLNALQGTPFANGGSGGTIYIPKALYDHLGDGSALDYKAATNWATLDGYGTITWAQIEGSQYENAYADGTPIS